MAATITLRGQLPDGRPVHQYELENDRLKIMLLDLGAALVELECPDSNGHWDNVTLGYESLDGYFANPSYMGCTVGRFANRIARGNFSIGDKQYTLATNNGPNHLHGGVQGFSHKIWSAKVEGSSVVFTYRSPDGEEGYPGNLDVTVKYHLEGAELTIDYTAKTDAPTVVNLTNHAYWNLGGAHAGAITGHELIVYASKYLECDADVLPTGRILPVDGTAFDFRKRKRIGAKIADTSGGYDHCFVLDGEAGTLRQAAKAVDPLTGRSLVILTTTPGIQLYTANHFDGTARSGGAPKHGGFCLECQGLPDAPNRPAFPSTLLKPGQTYRQTTVHRLSAE